MNTKVKREGEKVWVEGVENLAGWGRGQENTFIGSLTVAMRALGEKVDYDYLMGASGQAFRLQIHEPNWCASAPDAGCGFNCMETAMKALGYTWHEAMTEPKKDPPENHKDIVASILKGVPVVAMDLDDGMDWGVVAGFSQDGRQLLCRTYESRDDDYTPHRKWPWLVWVIERKVKVPDRSAILLRSLKLAVELANTKQYGEYASGFAAFEVWIQGLEDDTRFARLTEEEMRRMVQPNAWCYYSLYDARSSASRYLRSIKGEFPQGVADHLSKAAEVYGQVAAKLQEGQKHAPFPHQLKAKPWTAESRHAEARVLKDVLSLEKKAVAEIEAALTASETRAKEGRNTQHVPDCLETKRLVIRRFTPEDWSDFQELGRDWSTSKVPSFDKWETSDEASKGSVNYMSTSDKYFAVCLRDTKKVIGLLALNDQTDEERAKQELDLGHVIHGRYQDNDHDREALAAMIGYIFENRGMLSIVTHNPSDFPKQLAPLKSLGLKPLKDQGELGITREEWMRRKKEEGRVSGWLRNART